MVRILCLALALVTGCATPLGSLEKSERAAICDFLSSRAQQGDFLGCYLAAQRAAAGQSSFGRRINPVVEVTAVVVYDRFGQPTALRRLATTLPDEASDPVLTCFRDALAGASLPPQRRPVKVPVRIVVDPMEPSPPDGVSHPSQQCLLGPSGSRY